MRNWTLATVLAVVSVLSGFLPAADAGPFGRRGRRHQECAAPTPTCCAQTPAAPVASSEMQAAAPAAPAACCSTQAPAVTTENYTYRTRRFARARRFAEPVSYAAPAAYGAPVAYVAPTSASACCTP
jgi:hypothetical protein